MYFFYLALSSRFDLSTCIARFSKNSGQMPAEILLSNEEREDERPYHYVGHCGNLVSPAGIYSA